MSRVSSMLTLTKVNAAASAATTYLYYSIPVPCRFVGFSWGYQTVEANADNTLDFLIAMDQDKDGTFDATGDTLHTNANEVGLLNSAAIGEYLTNYGDAASGGGAAVAVSVTETRVPVGATIRVTCVTAGTGTVPAINFDLHLIPLQPLE